MIEEEWIIRGSMSIESIKVKEDYDEVRIRMLKYY